MRKVKIIIADSNELIRKGLNAVLAEDPNVDSIKEVDDQKALKKEVEAEIPDVVILDHTSAGFSIDVVPEILNNGIPTRFLAITYDRSGNAIQTAIRSGVVSYVKKDCSISEIKDAVIDTARGKQFFCGKILEAISESSLNIENIGREELTCDSISLSKRELEIIELIAEGHTNGEIAERLFLSDHTVTTHRKNIMKKLGVRNTAGIVLYAVKTELVSPNRFLFANKE